MHYRLPVVFLFFLLYSLSIAQIDMNPRVTIIDAQHYSHVFGEMRNYRIFLPPDYHDLNEEYPVIYFMHGWSQRYFGSGPDAYSEYDQGADNGGDNIEKFVSQHQVIVVKSDGYNRSKNEEYYLRPYNVGPVETHRQFPIYFEELIHHIDREYRTLTDRGHRAISGLSMGGFMSFFIGGKYPHLFSAVGSFCGSPEFVIGPKDMPLEYRHMDLYRNYDGMNVRLHYGDQDFIRGYHEDLNRVWQYTMDHYSYKIFPGDEHTTSGLGEMFEFLFNTFQDPPEKPESWTHTDIYPEFEVWNYQVSSDRDQPGFTTLENVNPLGFTSTIREFLPDGPMLSNVNLSVLTDTIYEKNKPYIITGYNAHNNSWSQESLVSDQYGRLKIQLNGARNHIGINYGTDVPNIVLLKPVVENNPWAQAGKEVRLSLRLLNKGLSESGELQIRLTAESEAINFTQNETTCSSIDARSDRKSSSPLIFQVRQPNAEMIRLTLNISNGAKSWTEDFEIPLKPEVSEIEDYQIADGRTFVVATGGNEVDTLMIGRGNGDGVPNPGESIEVLVKDQDVLRRTLVTANSTCINPDGMNIRESDYWGRYDHVGGSAKYSVLTIGSQCQAGEPVPLFLEYWLPDRPLHIIKRGTISISVVGRDETPPEIRWTDMTGKNLLQVKVHDGAPVKAVTGTFLAKNKSSFMVTLNDEGQAGDRVKSDGVFSVVCPPQLFDFYQLTLELEDIYANKSSREIKEPFVLHH